MTKAIFAVLILTMTIGTGCADIPKIGCIKRGSASINPGDQITSAEQAKEAIGLLRDSHSFPYSDIEDVDIAQDTVTLKGHKSTVESSQVTTTDLSSPFSTLLESFGLATLTESHNQVSIWFSDVQKVTLEHINTYGEDDRSDSDPGYVGGLVKLKDGFLCHLHLKDNQVVSFYSSDRSYIDRVASGFCFLTKQPLTDEVQFNGLGIGLVPYHDPNDEAAAAPIELIGQVRLGSPADAANIPLGTKIVAIDGVETTGGKEEQALLDKLHSGKHTIKTRRWDSIFGGKIWTVQIP